MRPLLRLEDKQHCGAISGSYLWTTPYATRLLESGAGLVDIQALPGHVNLATTQIYTHVNGERMADVVSML
jgi:integrase/recombinase XerD